MINIKTEILLGIIAVLSIIAAQLYFIIRMLKSIKNNAEYLFTIDHHIENIRHDIAILKDSKKKRQHKDKFFKRLSNKIKRQKVNDEIEILIQIIEVLNEQYSTEGEAKFALKSIQNHYMIISIQHEFKIKSVGEKFRIYRDFKPQKINQ